MSGNMEPETSHSVRPRLAETGVTAVRRQITVPASPPGQTALKVEQ